MLSLTTIPSCSLMPASDIAKGQAPHTATSAEALLASLVAHLRDKSLSDSQCVLAIRTLLRQSAGV